METKMDTHQHKTPGGACQMKFSHGHHHSPQADIPENNAGDHERTKDTDNKADKQ